MEILSGPQLIHGVAAFVDHGEERGLEICPLVSGGYPDVVWSYRGRERVGRYGHLEPLLGHFQHPKHLFVDARHRGHVVFGGLERVLARIDVLPRDLVEDCLYSRDQTREYRVCIAHGRSFVVEVEERVVGVLLVPKPLGLLQLQVEDS